MSIQQSFNQMLTTGAVAAGLYANLPSTKGNDSEKSGDNLGQMVNKTTNPDTQKMILNQQKNAYEKSISFDSSNLKTFEKITDVNAKLKELENRESGDINKSASYERKGSGVPLAGKGSKKAKEAVESYYEAITNKKMESFKERKFILEGFQYGNDYYIGGEISNNGAKK